MIGSQAHRISYTFHLMIYLGPFGSTYQKIHSNLCIFWEGPPSTTESKEQNKTIQLDWIDPRHVLLRDFLLDFKSSTISFFFAGKSLMDVRKVMKNQSRYVSLRPSTTKSMTAQGERDSNYGNGNISWLVSLKGVSFVRTDDNKATMRGATKWETGMDLSLIMSHACVSRMSLTPQFNVYWFDFASWVSQCFFYDIIWLFFCSCTNI